MSKELGRQMVPGTGTFFSVASAFKGVPHGLEHFAKFQFSSVDRSEKNDSFTVEDVVLTDRLLLDFGAIGREALNAERLAQDCEIVRTAAIEHPEKLKSLLGIFAGAARPTVHDIEKAQNIAEHLGLTEQATLRSGGGLLFLMIMGVALLAGGCAHCGKYVRR